MVFLSRGKQVAHRQSYGTNVSAEEVELLTVSSARSTPVSTRGMCRCGSFSSPKASKISSSLTMDRGCFVLSFLCLKRAPEARELIVLSSNEQRGLQAQAAPYLCSAQTGSEVVGYGRGSQQASAEVKPMRCRKAAEFARGQKGKQAGNRSAKQTRSVVYNCRKSGYVIL